MKQRLLNVSMKELHSTLHLQTKNKTKKFKSEFSCFG